jgi:hypothetical protein
MRAAWRLPIWVLISAAGLCCNISHGAMQGQPPAPPSPTSPSSPAREPTLDELLGIKEEKKPPAPAPDKATGESVLPSAETDRAKAELERKLAMQEIEDAFEQAVGLMKSTATKLQVERDAGVATQRMQEETLLKLDTLLDAARKQQQRKRKQKQSQQDQQNQDQQQQSQQQSQSSQAQQQQQAAQAQAGGQAGNPSNPLRTGTLNPPPGAGAAWGNLPQRLRDALMQGSGDYTSARWEALTREYYKRLAEEPVGGVRPVGPARPTSTTRPAGERAPSDTGGTP